MLSKLEQINKRLITSSSGVKILLAGKANLEGDLYLSRSIPYTIETLAIEFNRDMAQVKLALELLVNLIAPQGCNF